MLTVRPIHSGEGRVCEDILRALPDWFGIESAIVQYVRDTETMPTWVAEMDGAPAGFVTLHRHFPHAAEIHCMAVRPEAHRHGVGRALLEHVEAHCRTDGVMFLQVKTLAPSVDYAPYTHTRAFYLAMGFTPLEELPNLWPGNPCLVLVKRL